MSNGCKIIIMREHLRGEDNHIVFSIRIRKETADRLDEVLRQADISRNELICRCIDYALGNIEIVEQ